VDRFSRLAFEDDTATPPMGTVSRVRAAAQPRAGGARGIPGITCTAPGGAFHTFIDWRSCDACAPASARCGTAPHDAAQAPPR